MKKFRRLLGIVTVWMLLASGCGTGIDSGKPRVSSDAQSSRGSGPESLLGKPLPAFQMTDIRGNVVTNEGLKGKVVLIDFWATWCGPCRKASPVLQALHEKYAARGLVVMGANTSERDESGKPVLTKERAAGYAEEHGYTYTFTYGTDDFKNTCRVQGLPTIFVVDREGVVKKVLPGFREDLMAVLEKAIAPLLGG